MSHGQLFLIGHSGRSGLKKIQAKLLMSGKDWRMYGK